MPHHMLSVTGSNPLLPSPLIHIVGKRFGSATDIRWGYSDTMSERSSCNGKPSSFMDASQT